MKDPSFIATPNGSKTDDAGKTAESDCACCNGINALWQPRQVFLFSGHMIDSPDRPEPRFPAALEAVAARAIGATLDKLGAGPEDLALCSGACGGDILFAEACLKRGVRLEVRLPFAITTFLEKSVSFAGEGWRVRFHAVKDNPLTTLSIMPDKPGVPPSDTTPYTSTNLWLLNSAFAWGEDKVHFICLWNRQGGDGTGGTEHMYNEVNKRAGQAHLLDTNILFTLP